MNERPCDVCGCVSVGYYCVSCEEEHYAKRTKETAELKARIVELEKLVIAQTDRIGKQSDLLSKKAEGINPKWLRMAGSLLRYANSQFINHGCNDWVWPPDWTAEDRRTLVKTMHEWNLGKPFIKFTNKEAEGVEVDMSGKYGPADCGVMSFLAAELIRQGSKSNELDATGQD